MTNAKAKQFPLAVIIGRFQIFHYGHLALLEKALAVANRVIVLVGSAFKARDGINPFSWQERQSMIEGCITAKQRARIFFLPLRDYYDLAKWSQALSQGVEQIAHQHGITAAEIALIGHFKDASSDYLANFPQWNFVELDAVNWPNGQQQNATFLRQLFFQPSENKLLQQVVPAAVFEYLQSLRQQPLYQQLQQYWLAYSQLTGEQKAEKITRLYLLIQQGQQLLLESKTNQFSSASLAIPSIELNAETPRDQVAQTLLQRLVEVSVAPKMQFINRYDSAHRVVSQAEVGYLYFCRLAVSTQVSILAKQVNWYAQKSILANGEFLHDDGLNLLCAGLNY